MDRTVYFCLPPIVEPRFMDLSTYRSNYRLVHFLDNLLILAIIFLFFKIIRWLHLPGTKIAILLHSGACIQQMRCPRILSY